MLKIRIFITWWFLFQLLIEINCQTLTNKLKERYDHTATLIDNKLYILGGLSSDGAGKDFFILIFLLLLILKIY
jgi:hypothetical protein